MNKGISIEKVTFSYGGKKPVLSDINCRIAGGTFLGITGVNGSGKSTFSFLLNGLIPRFVEGNFRGNVFIDGISTRDKSVSFFAGKVGMVFQNPDFSLFNLTVREEIMFGLKNLGIDNALSRAAESLKDVRLEGYGSRDPQTLSFGEKQKVNLACVISLGTDYIVLDEPSAMLDYKSSLEIYDILAGLNRQGKTVIVIEHDTDFLARYTSEVMILDKGKIVTCGATAVILKDTGLLNKLGIKIPNIK